VSWVENRGKHQVGSTEVDVGSLVAQTLKTRRDTSGFECPVLNKKSNNIYVGILEIRRNFEIDSKTKQS
jgi:hypothetical protein